MAPIHDRMPVILTEDQAQEWTFIGNSDAGCLKLLLALAPDDLLAIRHISRDVNNRRIRGTNC